MADIAALFVLKVTCSAGALLAARRDGRGDSSFEKLANAFDLPYLRIETHEQLDASLKKILNTPGGLICEVMQDWNQVIEPRTMSRRLDDGRIVSPPIDDLFPFLDEKQYAMSQFEYYRQTRRKDC